jgi:type I restriction enzyme S subunit
MKQGWEIVKLPEVVFFQEGPGLRKFQYTETGVPFLNIRTLVNDRVDKLLCGHLSEKEVNEKYQHFLLQEGDIICSTSGTIGKLAIVHSEDLPLMLNTSVIRFRELDNKIVFRNFIYYYLKSDLFLSQAKDAAKGQAQVNFGPSHLKQFDFILPPLPEQQRIVVILDEAFAAIAKAKANAEQNLKNAKELFESVLNSLIIDDGNLKMEKLGDVCEIKGRIGYRGYTVQDLVQKGEGAITLSPSNIQENKFITDKCTYISWFKYEESPEIMVFEGDILFVKTGSTYGKVALVENLPEKATINPQFVVLKDIKCSNRFLYYALTTKAFKEKVENIVGGAATPTLSQTNLAEQTIPLPPLKEQQTIVRQLDALRAETQKLEAVYQKKIDDLEELKKSILKKAFAGELKTEKAVAL